MALWTQFLVFRAVSARLGEGARGPSPRVTGPRYEHDADHKKAALSTLTGVRLRAFAPVSALRSRLLPDSCDPSGTTPVVTATAVRAALFAMSAVAATISPPA